MWLPIRYFSFFDVPRQFVVEFGGRSFVFDCRFDDQLDDYPDEYRIFEVVAGVPESLPWDEAIGAGVRRGSVPVRAVRFDASMRRYVESSVLEDRL